MYVRTHRILTLLSILGIGSTANATFVQWEIANGGNGNFYGLTEIATDWLNGESIANTFGGNLVAINNAAEQQFIVDTFLQVPREEARPLWIGLNDTAGEGTFVWSNGLDPLTYTNWKVGEPNNFEGAEDYVAINWEYGRGGPIGTWNDAPLAGSGYFGLGTQGPYFGIIETTVNPVPMPAAAWLFASSLVGLIGVSAKSSR